MTTDLVEPIQIGDRIVKKITQIGLGYEWETGVNGIVLQADRISPKYNDLMAEIKVLVRSTRGDSHIHMGNYVFTSPEGKDKLLASLIRHPQIRTWGLSNGNPRNVFDPDNDRLYTMVEQFCSGVQVYKRNAVERNVVQKRAKTPIQYLVDSLILKSNRPNLLFAPGGCVAGETVIQGPDGDMRADELCGSGIAPVVWALSQDGHRVQAQAGPVYKKGVTDLYEYQFASGKRIVATLEHRFLGKSGWLTGRETNIGSSLAVCAPVPQERYSSVDQSMSHEDDPHSSQTVSDLMDHYSSGRYRYDRQPLQCVGSVQSVTPSLAYAASRNHLNCKTDDLEISREHSHRRMQFHHSRNGYAQDGPSLATTQVRVDGSLCVRSEQEYQLGQLSHCGCVARYVRNELNLTRLESIPAQPVDQFSSFDHDTLYWDTLESKSFVRSDVYYDLTVPGYENYLANGIWNHNSGKSYVLSAVCVGMMSNHGIGNLTMMPGCVPGYFDWEEDFEVFEDRVNTVSRGYGLEEPPPVIHYRLRGSTISERINDIAKWVQEDGITVGFIDSMSAAAGTTGSGQGWDSVSHGVFDALGLIPNVTWVIIGHVDKAHLSKPAGAMFGSVQTMNRSCNAWEVRSEQGPGEKVVHMKFHDTKHNHTGFRDVIGLAMEFVDDYVTFESESANSIPVNLVDRMTLACMNGNNFSRAELAERLHCEYGSITTIMSKDKKNPPEERRFVNLKGGLIGLSPDWDGSNEGASTEAKQMLNEAPDEALPW